MQPAINQVRLDGGDPIANPQPPPPANLPPGTHNGAFLAKFDTGHEIWWTVNGETVKASATISPRLQPVVLPGGGIGVVIGGRTLALTPDKPQEPTPQSEPAIGAPFNGALAGILNVSASGAATYTVPITIPPGIAGMAPNLSLVYSSQGGNGIAGQGWQLAGVSMIHRCPKTRVQDGAARPVQMSGWEEVDPRSGDVDPRNKGGEFDGICLDGKRLFEKGPNEYELELNDFSTVKCSADHKTFTVVTKSGETRYYGQGPKSRIEFTDHDADPRYLPKPKQIAVWALDRVVDAWGNYFDIKYNNGTEDYAQSGLLVTSIEYTGHFGGASRDNDQPTFHTINFEYEGRTDMRTARFRHSRIPMPMRLWKISTPLGRYTLTYLPRQRPNASQPPRQHRLLRRRELSCGAAADVG